MNDARMHFPTAKRFVGLTVKEQQRAIMRENAEVVRAIHDGDPERVAEEVWDVIHAAETLLAILADRGINVHAIRDQVEEKNRGRGYYEKANPNA